MSPGIDAVGIVVGDMARSLSFYRALGLQIPPEADEEQHVEVALPGGLRLMFDTVELMRGFDPGYVASAESGGISLAFRCDSVADVDRLHDELVAAGHRSHLAPFDAFWGQRYATIDDPDGNPVDVFAPLPDAPRPSPTGAGGPSV